MSKIILASSSPRRKELLNREGIDFIVDASCIDEVLDESLPLKSQLMKLSYDKGEPILMILSLVRIPLFFIIMKLLVKLKIKKKQKESYYLYQGINSLSLHP